MSGTEEASHWRLYAKSTDFPPFLCPDCLGADTWIDAVPVVRGKETIGFIEGQRGCVDCWTRRLDLTL